MTRKSPKQHPVNCTICGKEFQGNHRSKFCSPDCRNVSRRKNYTAGVNLQEVNIWREEMGLSPITIKEVKRYYS